MVTISKILISVYVWKIRRVGQHAHIITGRTQVVAVSVDEYALLFAIYTMHE